jgi:putative membrane protein insertion efficiency factor
VSAIAAIPRRVALALLLGYQVALSPFTRGSCRHLPSCSQYAREAVVRYGAGRGLWLAFKRLARCHPLGSSGWDPVP